MADSHRQSQVRAPATFSATVALDPLELVRLIASRPDAADALRALVAEREETTVSPYLSPDEAAEYLRVSRKRIYDMAQEGRLTRLKVGRSLLLYRSEVEQLVELAS